MSEFEERGLPCTCLNKMVGCLLFYMQPVDIYVIGRRLFSGLSKISGLQCTVDVHVSCTQLYSVQICTALASLLPFDEPIVR